MRLKAPAAYCLLALGQEGLRALADPLEEPTSKNVSLAFRLLASTGGRPP